MEIFESGSKKAWAWMQFESKSQRNTKVDRTPIIHGMETKTPEYLDRNLMVCMFPEVMAHLEDCCCSILICLHHLMLAMAAMLTMETVVERLTPIPADSNHH